MAFPTSFIPDKINFRLDQLQPKYRHQFDDGGEVRIGRIAFNDIFLNVEKRGASSENVLTIMEHYKEQRGDRLRFTLPSSFFTASPYLDDLIKENQRDTQIPLAFIEWYYIDRPVVVTQSVGVYDVSFTLRSYRRIFGSLSLDSSVLD